MATSFAPDNTPFVVGTDGADRLSTTASPALLQGGLGDDTYELSSAAQSVFERPGEGSDTIRLSFTDSGFLIPLEVENLLVFSSEGGYTYRGNAGSNRIEVGGFSADVLDGGAGNDSLAGGGSDDTYLVDAAGDVVIETEGGGGADVVRSGLSTYVLPQFVERGEVLETGRAGDLTGNAASNRLEGNLASNRLVGQAGNDTLHGTRDADDGSAPDFLDGGVGDDSLRGAVGIDTLLGGAGDDVLDGGEGRDSLVGGAGDDTYVLEGDITTDVIVEAPGGGLDVVRTTRSQFVLPTEVEVLLYLGGGAITGTGNASGNRMVGGDGADTLSGLAGNDVLDGLEGVDRMEGGTGNDTYVVDEPFDQVIERVGEGVDTVQATRSYTLGANFENLVLLGSPGPVTPAANGRGNELNNVITGNGAANLLEGFGGNDVLDGQAGRDTLIGGLGNDTYRLDNAGDVVIEAAGAAAGTTDLVRATVSVLLAANVENLELLGGPLDALAALGNAAANRITGDTGDNFIDGGAGADTMIGGAGNDVYTVDVSGDVVTELAGGGRDVVLTALGNYVLPVFVEDLDLLPGGANATGNTGDNVLRGSAGGNRLTGLNGNDTLLGRGGNDTLEGGAGNDLLDGGRGSDNMSGGIGDDTYVVDGADSVSDEGGIDTVRAFGNVAALGAGIEKLELYGAAFSAIGNGLNNVMTGNSRANVLDGGAGNDLLDGGTGPDTLVGGLGNDTFLVDDPDDAVFEANNEGRDVVRASVTVDVSTASIEEVVLLGTGSFGATGNALANLITGNAGNNVLFGLEGNDTLVGGAGNDELDGTDGADSMTGGDGDDTYVVDLLADRVVELSGGGTDTVVLSNLPAPGAGQAPRYELGPNVENLRIQSSFATTGTVLIGNGLDNVITGDGASNRLEGREGNDWLDGDGAALDPAIDTLVGGAGNDTYVVNDAGDVVVELAGGGVDTLRVLLPVGDVDLRTAMFAQVERATLAPPDPWADLLTPGIEQRSILGNALSNLLRVETAVVEGASARLFDDLGGDDTYGVDSLAGGGTVILDDRFGGTDRAVVGLTGESATVDLRGGGIVDTRLEELVINGAAAGPLSAALFSEGRVASLVLGSSVARGTGSDVLTLSGLDPAEVRDLTLRGIESVVRLDFSGDLVANDPLQVRLEGVGASSGPGAATLDFVGSASLATGVLVLDSRGGVENRLSLPDAGAFPEFGAGGLAAISIRGDTALELRDLPNGRHLFVTDFSGGRLLLDNDNGAGTPGFTLTVRNSDVLLGLNLEGAPPRELDLVPHFEGVSRVELSETYPDVALKLRTVYNAGESLTVITRGSGDVDANGYRGNLTFVDRGGDASPGIDFVNTAAKASQGSFTLLLGGGNDDLTFGANLSAADRIDGGSNIAGSDFDTLTANVTGLGVVTGRSGALSLSGLESIVFSVENPGTDGAVQAVIDGSGIVDAGGTNGTTVRVGDAGSSLANAVVELADMNVSGIEALANFAGELRAFVRTDLLPGFGALDVFMAGGLGNDVLAAGNGDDSVLGGGGDDTLSGGLGDDRFLFTAGSVAGLGVDTITDFEAGADRLVLDSALFPGLSTNGLGVLLADELVFQSTAPAGGPATAGKLVYVPGGDPAGSLFYDPEGTDAPVLIARLGAGLLLNAADIDVISFVS